jgi:hypothetical protein
MLVRLTRLWHRRAAAFVVALYALSLVTPVAAFATIDTRTPAHCLSLTDNDHLAMGETHGHHHDGMEHGQSAPDDHAHGLADKCCGLFSVTAIAPALDSMAAPATHGSNVALPAAASLLGRSSSRIDRPPRLLPSH